MKRTIYYIGNTFSKHMKKILVSVSVLTAIILMLLGFTSPILTASAAWNESHPDTWSAVATYWYRDSTTSPTTTPSIEIDYSGYTSAYNSTTKETNYANLLATISKVELAMIDSAGAYASSGTYRNILEVEFGAYNQSTKAISMNVYSTVAGGSRSLYGPYAIPLPADSRSFPSIMITFNLSSGTLDFRWGSFNTSIYAGFGSWLTNDAGSSTYNTAIKFYQGYTINGTAPSYTAKSTTTIGSSNVVFDLDQYRDVADTYFDDLVSWNYNLGFDAGYLDGKEFGEQHPVSSVLFDGFATIIGILSNFVMVFLTLEIFDVSILSVFGVIIGIAGIVFILKLVRG